MAEAIYQFGEFEFDTGSGELRRIAGDADAKAVRLPPQPAALLALLAANKGELVTREEICETLWPDTQVEFDAGLHFCVRQIRSALGDSASEARYIENLPRRGYRLAQAVTLVEPDEARSATPWRFRSAIAVVVVAVIAVVAFGLLNSVEKPDIRVGIMPFMPLEETPWPGAVSPMAEWILEDLMARAVPEVGIVGPTTTTAYQASDATMDQLAEEYTLDYLVNGRFIVDEDGATMFAELIRVSDGAHVWVKRYDDLREGRLIGLEISANVARKLKRSFGERSDSPAQGS